MAPYLTVSGIELGWEDGRGTEAPSDYIGWRFCWAEVEKVGRCECRRKQWDSKIASIRNEVCVGAVVSCCKSCSNVVHPVNPYTPIEMQSK